MKKIKNLSILACVVALSFTGAAYATNNTQMPDFSSSSAVLTAKTNLNTANAKEIAGKIKGIGQKRAEAIVSYRNQHGAYKSLDELANVKGIGESFVKAHLNELNQTFTLS